MHFLCFSLGRAIFSLMFPFKENIAVRILVHSSQISYKCVFNSVIGAFKVRVVYDLIYVLETHIYSNAKDNGRSWYLWANHRSQGN